MNINVINSLKIRNKILLGFGSVLFILIVISVFSISSLLKMKDNIDHLENQSVKAAIGSLKVQTSVFQVQQWLTDISATRALDGLDDGFAEAEEWAKAFYAELDMLRGIYSNDPKVTSELDGIDKAFMGYYDMGKKMARAYIDGGPETGNKIMGEFDTFAEEINTRVGAIAERNMTVLNTTITQTKARANHLSKISMFLTLIAIVVGILSALFISNKISTPVREIIERIKDIAEGEWDLTKRINVSSNDEIGELATWFNTFIIKLHEIVSNVVSSTRSLVSNSEQLFENSSSISQGADDQATQSERVATAMTEMSSTVMEVAKNTQSAAEMAKDAQSIAARGGEVVFTAVAGIEQLTSLVEGTAGEVRDLGGNSEQIGEIISVIDDIADQTNLLALNAAIEAARAGEQGRGFAVVADEVRQLAERTTKATAEVRQRIGTVQDETSKVVSSMEEGAKKSGEGIELVRRAGNALEEIVQSVDKVSEMIQQIATASEEQSVATEEIANNVEGIARITSGTAGKMKDSSGVIENLNNTAIELKRLVEGFKV